MKNIPANDNTPGSISFAVSIKRQSRVIKEMKTASKTVINTGLYFDVTGEICAVSFILRLSGFLITSKRVKHYFISFLSPMIVMCPVGYFHG